MNISFFQSWVNFYSRKANFFCVEIIKFFFSLFVLNVNREKLRQNSSSKLLNTYTAYPCILLYLTKLAGRRRAHFSKLVIFSSLLLIFSQPRIIHYYRPDYCFFFSFQFFFIVKFYLIKVKLNKTSEWSKSILLFSKNFEIN